MLAEDRCKIKVLYYNRPTALLRIAIAIRATITSYAKDYRLLY
jgi:hypothetical protein